MYSFRAYFRNRGRGHAPQWCSLESSSGQRGFVLDCGNLIIVFPHFLTIINSEHCMDWIQSCLLIKQNFFQMPAIIIVATSYVEISHAARYVSIQVSLLIIIISQERTTYFLRERHSNYCLQN